MLISTRLHLAQRIAMRRKHITPPHPLIEGVIPLTLHPRIHRLPLLLGLPFLPQRAPLSLNRHLGHHGAV